jgi:hypothetical protein
MTVYLHTATDGVGTREVDILSRRVPKPGGGEQDGLHTTVTDDQG